LFLGNFWHPAFSKQAMYAAGSIAGVFSKSRDEVASWIPMVTGD
jgi:hypothetical protein